MRSYEYLSPQRLRQASLLVIALSGASTGLLAGLGWRLFQTGSQQLAALVWLVSCALVVVYLLVALLARAVAVLIETRQPPDFAQALQHLQRRVEEIERELDSPRASRSTRPRVATFEPPVGTSAL